MKFRRRHVFFIKSSWCFICFCRVISKLYGCCNSIFMDPVKLSVVTNINILTGYCDSYFIISNEVLIGIDSVFIPSMIPPHLLLQNEVRGKARPTMLKQSINISAGTSKYQSTKSKITAVIWVTGERWHTVDKVMFFSASLIQVAWKLNLSQCIFSICVDKMQNKYFFSRFKGFHTLCSIRYVII